MTDLIFWIVVLIAFFFGFRWLQNRKKWPPPGNTRAPEAKSI